MLHYRLVPILLVWLSTVLYAHDTYQLAGVVHDETGEAQTGANIYIPQLEEGTVADQNGEFRLTGLPAWKLIIQVSFIGYESYIRTLWVGKDTPTLDISLHPVTITAGEVVISGGRHSTQHENAIKIELLNASTLKQIASSDLIEKLAELPGVDVISRGGSVTSPVVRGLSTNNILVLNDGFRMENYQFSADHPYLVDETGLERVEVIKGPASLLYGSDAIGGVINLVGEKPAPSRSVSGDANVRYFSNTAGLEGSLGVKGHQGAVTWEVRGAYRSHQDYTGGDGRLVPNSRFNGGSFKTTIGIRGKFSLHRLAYKYQQLKPGLTNEASRHLVRSNGRYHEIWYQDLDNHQIMSRNQFYLNPFKLHANFSYQHNHWRLITDEPDHPNVDMQLGIFSYEFRGNLVTSEVSEFTLAVQGLS